MKLLFFRDVHDLASDGQVTSHFGGGMRGGLASISHNGSRYEKIQTLKMVTIIYFILFHLAKQLQICSAQIITSFPLETSIWSPILLLFFGPCRPQHMTFLYLRPHFWVTASSSLPLIFLSSFIRI